MSEPSAASIEHVLEVPESVPMLSLLGHGDSVLRAVEQGFTSVDVHVRGSGLTLRGNPAAGALVERLFDELIDTAPTGHPPTADAVQRAAEMLPSAPRERPADVLTLNILSSRGRTIRPKTLNQKRYVEAIDANTIVFVICHAGTGKTYLDMANAVNALQY